MLDGTKLKFLRYSHGKTQAQVAQFCDVTTRAIKAYEANELKPSAEVYAAYLNCIYGVGRPLSRPKTRKPKQTAEQPENTNTEE